MKENDTNVLRNYRMIQSIPYLHDLGYRKTSSDTKLTEFVQQFHQVHRVILTTS